MVNEELSLDDIQCIENYLNDKYQVFGRGATENPGQCLTQNTTDDLVGWYTGDSFNITTNKWQDISGNDNYGFISGSGIELFNGNDTNDEFYINGEKVVRGTIYSKIVFRPLIYPQHTIFNVCKYKKSGTKRKILQAEKYYGGMIL